MAPPVLKSFNQPYEEAVSPASQLLRAWAVASASKAMQQCRVSASSAPNTREHAGHRGEIADIAVDDAEQRSDGRLVRRGRIKLTHPGRVGFRSEQRFSDCPANAGLNHLL
jgi:hypothetical protein